MRSPLPARVLLNWALAKGCAVPSSATAQHFGVTVRLEIRVRKSSSERRLCGSRAIRGHGVREIRGRRAYQRWNRNLSCRQSRGKGPAMAQDCQSRHLGAGFVRICSAPQRPAAGVSKRLSMSTRCGSAPCCTLMHPTPRSGEDCQQPVRVHSVA